MTKKLLNSSNNSTLRQSFLAGVFMVMLLLIVAQAAFMVDLYNRVDSLEQAKADTSAVTPVQ